MSDKKQSRVIGGNFVTNDGSIFQYVGHVSGVKHDIPLVADFYKQDTNPMTSEKSAPTTGAVGPVERVMVYRRQNEKDETVSEVDVQLRHGCYWVTNVWTTAEYRGRGYATSLMTQVIKDMSYIELWLFVFATGSRVLDDEQLKRWYGTFGFEEIDEVPGIMVRELSFDE